MITEQSVGPTLLALPNTYVHNATLHRDDDLIASMDLIGCHASNVACRLSRGRRVEAAETFDLLVAIVRAAFADFKTVRAQEARRAAIAASAAEYRAQREGRPLTAASATAGAA